MEEQLLLPIRLCRNDNEANEGDVVIQVQENLNKLLEQAAADEGRQSRGRTQPSIYKIPEFMREIQKKAFEPQLVSFGPYYHGESRLASMEVVKKKAFCRFITNNGLNFDTIVKRVSNNLKNLWGAYDTLEEKWKEDGGTKFLEVMIVDACFMLDFFKECPTSLINMSWDIKRDMLLLENQLPMQLLEQLYTIAQTNQEIQDQSLSSLICKSMCIDVKGVTGGKSHILEMYRASLLNPPIDYKDRSGKKKDYESSDLDCQIIPQATQLREAGIKFEKSDTNILTDVSFDSKQSVLKMPNLAVDDNTESTLLNVMAFEKLHVEGEGKVTSFICLMNNLIDADKDVTLLASNKILGNALGNDESAAKLFGLLGTGATLNSDSHIIDLQHSVNQHCTQTWNRWCASLKHDYFHNPWAMISFLAAIFGFAIIIVQAVYQIADYHLQRK